MKTLKNVIANLIGIVIVICFANCTKPDAAKPVTNTTQISMPIQDSVYIRIVASIGGGSLQIKNVTQIDSIGLLPGVESFYPSYMHYRTLVSGDTIDIILTTPGPGDEVLLNYRKEYQNAPLVHDTLTTESGQTGKYQYIIPFN